MPLIVNLRTLAKSNVTFSGELTPQELDFGLQDDLVQVRNPVTYDLEVEQDGEGIIVRGSLGVKLECECVRCLKKFKRTLNLDPYTLDLPLEGEDAPALDNDNVDLTPFLRQDMLLEFPQHPLCKPDCAGLKKKELKPTRKSGEESGAGASAWAALNKLKL